MVEIENWYPCGLCGDPYRESELVLDEDLGSICKSCSTSKKDLDDEQEDEEIETQMREERKQKAGLYDKEGP